MQNNTDLCNVLSAINVAIMQRLAYVDIRADKFTHSVLLLLVRMGVIQGMEVISTGEIIRWYRLFIAHDYISRSRTQIEILSGRSYFNNIKLYQLHRLVRYNLGGLIVLTTTAGILTAEEAINRGVGGMLLLRVQVGERYK